MRISGLLVGVGNVGVALLSALLSLMRPAGQNLYQRLRRPVLIVIGGAILLMLLIVVLQSGLGVDSDETITDSHRPEIVGD